MRLTDDRLEGSRNFANKLWNGARFVLGEVGEGTVAAVDPSSAGLQSEDRWVLSRLQGLTSTVEGLLGDFQLGEAGRQVHDFLWNDYFDWYVEASKVRLRGGDASPLPVLVHVLDQGLRLLHPYMPFVTEAIWQELRAHLPEAGSDMLSETLIEAAWPSADAGWADAGAERSFEGLQEVVRAIRTVRADKSVEAGRWIEAYVVSETNGAALESQGAVIEALARARPLHVVRSREEAPSDQVVAQVLSGAEVVLPLGGLVDLEAERARLEKEIGESEGHLHRVNGKLSNAGFRSKAPAEVVEREEERRAEIGERLAGLRSRLAELN